MYVWGLHWPAFLMILQQAVELLQLGNDVVLDVRSGDLKPHTATVEGACEVTREHLIDHPSYNWNYLHEKNFTTLRTFQLQ